MRTGQKVLIAKVLIIIAIIIIVVVVVVVQKGEVFFLKTCPAC